MMMAKRRPDYFLSMYLGLTAILLWALQWYLGKIIIWPSAIPILAVWSVIVGVIEYLLAKNLKTWKWFWGEIFGFYVSPSDAIPLLAKDEFVDEPADLMTQVIRSWARLDELQKSSASADEIELAKLVYEFWNTKHLSELERESAMPSSARTATPRPPQGD